MGVRSRLVNQREDPVGAGLPRQGLLAPGHGQAPPRPHHPDDRIRRPRPAPPEPPRRHLLVPLNLHVQEGLEAVGPEEGPHRLPDGGAVPEPAAVQARGQVGQSQLGAFEPSLPNAMILLGLVRAPHPDEPEVIVRPSGTGAAAKHIGGVVTAPVVRHDGDRRPADRVPAELLANAAILPPAAGQDGHELPPVAGQLGEVVPGAEFAVGHVDEVRPAEEGAEGLQVGPVHTVIGPVPTPDPVQDGHRPVRRHGQAEQELLEIGPVVLVVAVGDPGLTDRAGVGPGEGDRRGVEMEPVGLEGEAFEHPQGQPEPEVPSPLGPERVQGPRHPIVVEGRLLRGREPEGAGRQGRRPLGDPVERGRGDEDVVDEDGQGLGMVEDPLAGRAQARPGDGLELGEVQEVPDQGVRAQDVGPERGGPLGRLAPMDRRPTELIYILSMI